MHQAFAYGVSRMELLLSGRTMVFVGHERCSCGLGCSGCAMRWLSGIGGEMVLPMVVLCTRRLTTEFRQWNCYSVGGLWVRSF